MLVTKLYGLCLYITSQRKSSIKIYLLLFSTQKDVFSFMNWSSWKHNIQYLSYCTMFYSLFNCFYSNFRLIREKHKHLVCKVHTEVMYMCRHMSVIYRWIKSALGQVVHTTSQQLILVSLTLNILKVALLLWMQNLQVPI